MKINEKAAPAGALTAALLSISCCLPFSIPAALGIAGFAAFASQNQLWLIGASLLLLVVGLVQLLRRPACDRKRSRSSVVLLCLSAVLVVAVVFLPEVVSGFLADHLP
jgi:cytochrome bd-type quinol oxidase subunit 2